MTIPGHKESLYGDGRIPLEELHLFEGAFDYSCHTVGTPIMHPADRRRFDFDHSIPCAHACDLSTLALRIAYERDFPQANAGEYHYYSSREAYRSGAKSIDPHYDFRPGGTLREPPIDLTLKQMPAEYYPETKGLYRYQLNFPYADINKRLTLLWPGMREPVLREFPRLVNPTPGMTRLHDLLGAENYEALTYYFRLEKYYPCLSIRLPWPYLIFSDKDPKTYEDRFFRPEEFGLKLPVENVVIQASKTIDKNDREAARQLGITIDENDKGRIFGAVGIDAVEQYTSESWKRLAPLSYELGDMDKTTLGLHLCNRRKLRETVKINGQPGFFPLRRTILNHTHADCLG